MQKYQHRPEIEFFDVKNDPLEMTNLAGEARYSGEIAKLREVLDHWMESQGDTGVDTELVANQHKRKQKKRN